MTILYVNPTSQNVLGAVGATSVSFSIDNTTVVGNTIIAIIATRQSTAGVTATVTDSRSNTWEIDNGPFQANNLHIFMASTNQDGGRLSTLGDTITVTYSHAISTSVVIDAREFSGLQSGAAGSKAWLDQTASNSGSSTTGPINAGSVVPGSANELIYTGMNVNDSSLTVFFNATGTVGSYSDTLENGTSNGTTIQLNCGARIVSGGAGVAQRQAFTASSPTSWQGVTASYLVSGGATTTKTFTDDSGSTDSISITQTKGITDSAGSTDSMIGTKGVFTDSAGSTDTFKLEQDKTFTDSAGLTDSVTVTQTKSITDSAGSTDSIVASGPVLVPVVSDSAGSTDSIIVTKNPLLTDSTGSTDSFVLERDVTVSSFTLMTPVQVQSVFRGMDPDASDVLATVTVTASTTLGNTLVLTAATRHVTFGTTVSVTDTKGNTWTIDNGPAQTSSDHIFMASTRQNGGALVAGVDMINIRYGNQRSAGVAVDIREFSGVLTTPQNYTDGIDNFGIDVVDAITGPVNTGVVTPSVGNDLIIAALVADRGPVITPGTGGTVGTYSDIATISTDTGITQKQFICGYQVTSLTITQQFDATFSNPAGYQGIITAYAAGMVVVPWDSAGSVDLFLAEHDLVSGDSAGSTDSLTFLLTHTPADPMDSSGSTDSLALALSVSITDDSGSTDSLAIEDDVSITDDSGSTDSDVEVYP